jgi:DNA-binding NtrC family response regulator
MLLMSAKIAVINHSAYLLVFYRVNLEKRGFEVVTFNEQITPGEAIEQENPDLIVLGNIITLTESEMGLFDWLRKQSTLCDRPIIIATTSPQIYADGVRDQPNTYLLMKPFHVEKFLTLVKEALGLPSL